MLGRPVLVSEQYPKGLGQTVAELAERLPEGAVTVEKLRFSACGVDAFDEALAAAGLLGVGGRAASRPTSASTRPCTTCWPAVLDVHVAADAVSSRTAGEPRPRASRRWPPTAPASPAPRWPSSRCSRWPARPEFKQISKLVR